MNTIVLLLHLIRRREEEGINHLKQDQDIWGGPVFIRDKKSRYSAGGLDVTVCRHQESSPETRLLLETAATISSVLTAILVAGICFCSLVSGVWDSVCSPRYLSKPLTSTMEAGYLPVRYSVKLIGEFKDLLEKNRNRERLFRRTVFDHWLDILSHDNDNHLMHYVLQHQDSNPNLELYATPVEKTGWFIASIQFINGLIDEDLNVSQDDGVGVVSGNCVDLQHNYVSAVSVLSANSHEGLNETRVGNNDMLILEVGDNFFNSEGGVKNPESNKDKQPTLADVLDEVRALRKEVALVKFDDARIAKLERLLNDNFMFHNDSSNGNHNAVNQGLSGLANHPMSTCSRPDIDNAEVSGHVIGIHKADGRMIAQTVIKMVLTKDYLVRLMIPWFSTSFGLDILDGEVVGALIGIHKADWKNDIPNVNHNAVN
ncbi:hypothetical protein Tco_0977838 [Tanacetum coccineum]|uniref:Uncharacterized protein n=1 Tax=Tanacetum coccineum TaxID=301880 RepID=A0ABQ5EL85_9ASTR